MSVFRINFQNFLQQTLSSANSNNVSVKVFATRCTANMRSWMFMDANMKFKIEGLKVCSNAKNDGYILHPFQITLLGSETWSSLKRSSKGFPPPLQETH